MDQNQKRVYRRAQRQPGQSFDGMSPRQSAPSFPTVGMTLDSYQGNNKKRSRRRTQQPTMSADQVAPQREWRQKITKKRVIIVIITVLVAIIGYVGWKFVYNAQRLFGGSIFSALSNGTLEGESAGRVNILLAGNSADDVGHNGGELTDSIMILSIDTKNRSGFMLSIPRDLYVRVPDNGSQKINAVYPIGEREKFNEAGYADGGMGLLQKTLKQTVGIDTQYYALVNYNALRDAVNSVGGITINVESSDRRGLYDPSRDYSTPRGILVKLPNGLQKLNGQQALNLARARGEARGSYGFANSDFDRTANQRKLILAIRQKATSAGVLTNPIKLGGLFDSIGGNVDTDLKLNNVKRLYEITKDIPESKIQSVGLNDANGQNLLTNYRTPSGASALVPAAGRSDFSDIQRYIRRLTSNNLVVRENAQVVVLNGTNTSGLAGKERDRLENKNFQITTIADADQEDYATTQIIDRSGGSKPASLKALQQAYPGATVTTTNPYGTKYDVSFIVVVGADRIPANSTE